MESQVQEEYDSHRDFTDKAFKSVCYAPHLNLYFDQWGKVHVCCWNTDYTVGDMTREAIDEIWHGETLQRLRKAVEHYSFKFGCERCEFQIANGWTRSTNMRTFDRFAVSDREPEWPRRIELSISNTCNLECVMCNGEFSSAIRSRREKLPPRPRIYPANFAESLRKYLPHLDSIKFLGGEPFLVSDYYQIWDMMIEDSLTTRCHVTTNGTIYNSRIEKYMDALPFGFAVSLDGVTKETVESIRVNADFDEQRRILKIFREYTKERKTDLSLTYCFMRQNWHEFGEFCRFADEWDCFVAVNMVEYPPQFGVYNLPLEELRLILKRMEQQSVELEPILSKNKVVWLNELERVRGRCSYLERPTSASEGV